MQLKSPSIPTITNQQKLSNLCELSTTNYVITPLLADTFEAAVYITHKKQVIGEVCYLSTNKRILVHFSFAEAFSQPFYSGVPTANDIYDAMHLEAIRHYISVTPQMEFDF